MGIDFLERVKKTINAGYDRRRDDLAREDLLTRHPECARYAGRMKLRPGVHVEPGDDVLVEERNGWMFASAAWRYSATSASLRPQCAMRCATTVARSAEQSTA
jgi:hypothetical protein